MPSHQYRPARWCSNGLCPPEQGDHVGVALERIQIVGQCLHHLAPLGEMLREVVGGADGVALGVGELALDDLILDGRRLEVPGRKRLDIDHGQVISDILA